MCKRVIFVVDSLFLQDENKSEERFLKKLAGGVALMFFAADRSTEKRKRLCGASMLLGNDAKFLLRD